MNKRSKAGFTLLEMTITLVILAMIGFNVSLVMKTSSTAYEAGIIDSELDNQSALTLERIRLALMSSSLNDLNPELSMGLHTSYIDYTVSLGLDESGELVMADPERIALEAKAGQVVWQQNLGTEDERSVVWTKNVPALYRGELPNGIDDNGNELLDEEGLFFKQEGGASVRVQLTVARDVSSGDPLVKDSRMTVTCRN